jgi:hypothetical protein
VRYRADYCMFAAEMAALARRKTKKDPVESQVPLKFAGAESQLLRSVREYTDLRSCSQ